MRWSRSVMYRDDYLGQQYVTDLTIGNSIISDGLSYI